MSDPTNLISQWLEAYQRGEHAAMAECYHEEATFEDIAFRLSGKKQIHAMWHMICANGIRVVEDVPSRVCIRKVGSLCPLPPLPTGDVNVSTDVTVGRGPG